MALWELGVRRGTRASQPAATAVAVGTLYYVTDEGVTERSSGSAWQTYADTTGASVLVQRGYAEYTTNADLTTAIPADDTIPQNSEGTEIITLAITPDNASNILRIDFVCWGAVSTTAYVIAALFVDSTADAIAVAASTCQGSGSPVSCVLRIEFAAGSTSARTYKIRVGPNTGTLRLNGFSNARIFGGVARAALTIEEFLP